MKPPKRTVSQRDKQLDAALDRLELALQDLQYSIARTKQTLREYPLDGETATRIEMGGAKSKGAVGNGVGGLRAG